MLHICLVQQYLSLAARRRMCLHLCAHVRLLHVTPIIDHADLPTASFASNFLRI